ncbi:hypothetical protein [Streptomyces sp. NPDC088847]|uniref:hypothetical protein n=1 Tax=Streptomyces sp. NPDC088847 TaxID=3365909 RepID=UPI00382FAB1C
MAKCCGLSPCNCRVVAGTGTTVTGNGSAATPYTISADPEPTALAVQDSATVDLGLTGTGTAGDPYTVTADVVLDPAPPAGGTNLLQESPDGLYVECDDVRGCLSAGDGIAYDTATGEISARTSTDPGNQTTIGTDGGLFTPSAATALEAADTPSVDVTITGTGTVGDPYQVAAAAILDPAPPGGGTNLLQESPDGLFVECADVRGCLSAGDGIAYDPGTGEIAARPSTDAGNAVSFGTDGGLYATAGGGAPSVVEGGDTPTASNTVTGTGAAGDPYVVTTDVTLDPTPPGGGTNLLQAGPDGLYVECDDVRGCLSAGDGIAYDTATGEISARVSADAGNQTTIGTDGGLFTPASTTAVEAADSPTVDVTITGTGAAGDPYEVAAAVILDPTPPGGGSNLLQDGPDGLFVECADVRGCLSAGDGIDYDTATGEIAAQISGDAGNTTTIGTDGGIYTPTPAATVVQAADTSTLNATVNGTGTAGDPYVVSGDVIVAPEDNGVEATASGLLVAPSADAGNRLAFGADHRLYVPPDVIGCGLQGDGSAGSPLEAFPIAGSQAWSDDWACAAAAHSTLKCDPASGALWTPPEHYTAADHLYQEHMNPVVSNLGPTGGWAFLQPGGNAAVVAFDVPANFLGNDCRQWSYSSHVHASIDISASATATFELGYIYQEDGGALQTRPIEGVLTAFGAARRERYAGSVSESGFNKAASGTLALHYFCAVRVLTGTITINSWTSDATIHTTTQGT